jgi:hypothetical protein
VQCDEPRGRANLPRAKGQHSNIERDQKSKNPTGPTGPTIVLKPHFNNKRPRGKDDQGACVRAAPRVARSSWQQQLRLLAASIRAVRCALCFAQQPPRTSRIPHPAASRIRIHSHCQCCQHCALPVLNPVSRTRAPRHPPLAITLNGVGGPGGGAACWFLVWLWEVVDSLGEAGSPWLGAPVAACGCGCALCVV